MIIERLEVGVFAENCYVVGCIESREGVVIDPGDEIPRVLQVIEKHLLKIQFILLTHAHIDHVKEAQAIKSELSVPLFMHRDDQFLLDNLPAQAASYGLATSGIPKVDQYLEEGQRIRFGKCAFNVVHTPGHSPGSVSFVAPKTAFVGDVLFAGSIGRTDLPGGDFGTLINSIQSKLFPLGDDTQVYPGHGPATTIGDERRTNPFLV